MPLFVLVYINVFGIDHIVIAGVARRSSSRGRSLFRCSFSARSSRLLIKRLGQFMRNCLQLIESFVQFLNSTLLQRLLSFSYCRIYVTSHSTDFLAIVVDGLFHLVNEPVQAIPSFNLFTLANVVGRVSFRITHHLVDL